MYLDSTCSNSDKFRYSPKNLSIILDRFLRFDRRVTKKASPRQSKLETLWELKHVLPFEVKYISYLSAARYPLTNWLLLSHIDYASCLYYTHLMYKNLMYRLQVLYSSCLRFSYNFNWRENATSHFNLFKNFKLQEQYTPYLSTLLYKILKNKESSYLYEMFKLKADWLWFHQFA